MSFDPEQTQGSLWFTALQKWREYAGSAGIRYSALELFAGNLQQILPRVSGHELLTLFCCELISFCLELTLFCREFILFLLSLFTFAVTLVGHRLTRTQSSITIYIYRSVEGGVALLDWVRVRATVIKIFHIRVTMSGNQWRSQPDNLVMLCKYFRVHKP